MSFDLFRNFGRKVLPFVAVAASLTLGACGDDEPTPAPAPRFAPVTMFNGSTDFVLNFRGSNNLAVDGLTYGQTKAGQALVSTTTTVNVERQSGQTVGSATINVDTNRLNWVAAASTVDEVIGLSTPRVLPVSPGQAQVRLFNISGNAPAVDLRQNTQGGPILAPNISYKIASSFTDVDTSVTRLWVVKAGGTDTLTSVDATGMFKAGKLYTVVLYGSTLTNATLPIQAKIVAEQ